MERFFFVGDHQIMVSYCEQPVKGSPFSCKVYDAGQVIVKHMPDFATVNQPVSFNSKFYTYLLFSFSSFDKFLYNEFSLLYF